MGLSCQPQSAAAIHTARAWELLWGAVGTWPHPDHSLKLQSFKTVPPAKEVRSTVELRNSSATRLSALETRFWGKVAFDCEEGKEKKKKKTKQQQQQNKTLDFSQV